MSSFINDGGAGQGRVLVRDLTIISTPTLTECINFSGTGGSGEIRGVIISLAGVDVGIKVDGSWQIHDCFIRVDDTAIVIDGDDCVITANRARHPTGFTDHAIIVNGNDNVISGNHLSAGIRIIGDDNIITDNLIANVGSADNGIIIDGDRNYIAGNKVFPDGVTPPVGIEIVSGATDNVIGLNDLEQATTDLTDAGTNTVFLGTFNGPDVLTTKGDIHGFDTVDDRIPIGTNDQILTADSAQGLGLKWDDLGVWTTWSPTYGNMTIGNGTVVSRFVEVGNLVVAEFDFLLGSTSSVGTSPTVSSPVTATTSYGNGNHIVATASLLEDGVIRYMGQVRMTNTTTFFIFAQDASATHLKSAGITATVPFIWGTNDRITFTAILEKA